jgi:hypothetical protein
MKNSFSLCGTDFHTLMWCQVQNDILLVFTVILVALIVLKCEFISFLRLHMTLTIYKLCTVLAALQLTSKCNPKFVTHKWVCLLLLPHSIFQKTLREEYS